MVGFRSMDTAPLRSRIQGALPDGSVVDMKWDGGWVMAMPGYWLALSDTSQPVGWRPCK